MNICRGCGDIVGDNDTHCGNCIAKIKNPTAFDRLIGGPMPASIKWYCWFGAWLLVILIALRINPSDVLSAPAFPIGLLAFLPNGEDKAIEAGMLGGWIIGWIFYILFSVAMFRVKNAGMFFILYVIFIVLLLLNIEGCQRVFQAVSEIH